MARRLLFAWALGMSASVGRAYGQQVAPAPLAPMGWESASTAGGLLPAVTPPHSRARALFTPMRVAVGLLGASVVAGHVLAPDSYSWKRNTISELAAQRYDNAWVVRSGFVSFGSLVSVAAARDLATGRKQWAQALPVAMYGAAIAMTAAYSAAPFEPEVPFSKAEANRHSLFATAAGISLSTAMAGHIVLERDHKKRRRHVAGLAVVTLSSIMFMQQPKSQGVWQRTMWLGGLGWLARAY